MDNRVGTDWVSGVWGGQGRATGENWDNSNWTTIKKEKKRKRKHTHKDFKFTGLEERDGLKFSLFYLKETGVINCRVI